MAAAPGMMFQPACIIAAASKPIILCTAGVITPAGKWGITQQHRETHPQPFLAVDHGKKLQHPIITAAPSTAATIFLAGEITMGALVTEL